VAWWNEATAPPLNFSLWGNYHLIGTIFLEKAPAGMEFLPSISETWLELAGQGAF